MSTAKIEAALDALSLRANVREQDAALADLVGQARDELASIRAAARSIDEDWENHGGREAAELIAAIAKESP